MAGEAILVIDDSAAIRSIALQALGNAGYRVTLAGNGPAALLAPEFDQYQLVILDASLDGVDGLRTTKELRADGEKSGVPILLLVDETRAPERESVDMGGANAFLLKPFEPGALVTKVTSVLNEHAVITECDKQLRTAIEHYIDGVCDAHVRESIESRTQLLAERAIQSVVRQVDEQARLHISERVTELAVEKEQELVRATVREAAQTTLESMAEEQVAQACEKLLTEATEQAVRRTVEGMLPSLARERFKEIVESSLPREIETRVRQTAMEMAPELSEQIVGLITKVAGKAIPKIARERVPEICEKQVTQATDRIVNETAQRIVTQIADERMAESVDALVSEAVAQVRRAARLAFGILVVTFLVLGGALVYLDQTGDPEPTPPTGTPSSVK